MVDIAVRWWYIIVVHKMDSKSEVRTVENFRGLIFSKYKNITEFASAVGWTRNKASRIANGIQEPDAEDMERMADALGITSPEQFMYIFFRSLSTKWTSAIAS